MQHSKAKTQKKGMHWGWWFGGGFIFLMVGYLALIYSFSQKETSGIVISGKPLEYWLDNLGDHDAILPENHALVNIGPEMIPPLIEAIQADYSFRDSSLRILPIFRDKSSGGNIRQTVAFRLGMFGQSASNAVPVLAELLDKPMKYTGDHGRIIQALGFIGEPAKPAIPSLVKHLDNPNKWNRFYVTHSLLQIGTIPKEVIPKIKQFLDTPSNISHAEYVALLAAEPNPSNIDRIKDILHIKNRGNNDRLLTAVELGYLETLPEELNSILNQMISEQDKSAQIAAAIGLANPDAQNSDQLVPLLMEGLKDGQFQIYCAEALGRLGSKAAPAIPLLSQSKGYVKKIISDRALLKIESEISNLSNE